MKFEMSAAFACAFSVIISFRPTIFVILGAFAQLRKATVRVVMSVCPSVRFSARME